MELCFIFTQLPPPPHQDAFNTVPSPEAIIGVPVGAAKSVPVCILVKPSIGCFLFPKLEDNLAPLIGVFMRVFLTLLPLLSKNSTLPSVSNI